MEPPAHRGSVHAQGAGVQESVAWAQAAPPTAVRGHEMLDELQSCLTPAEAKYRWDAFQQAHRSVGAAAKAGGIHVVNCPVMRSYPLPARKDHRRVDIVVHRGVHSSPTRDAKVQPW